MSVWIDLTDVSTLIHYKL